MGLRGEDRFLVLFHGSLLDWGLLPAIPLPHPHRSPSTRHLLTLGTHPGHILGGPLELYLLVHSHGGMADGHIPSPLHQDEVFG